MQLSPHDRVVIVGAGPAGMATAIELAQKGVPSVVLEKRAAVAGREPLFNVVPPMADRLAALDPEGSLTNLLAPVASMSSTHSASGRTATRSSEGPFAPDAARSRGDIDALLRAVGPSGASDADRRPWSMVGIGDLENGLRELARTKHSDLIELRPDTPVESIRQGDGWAEAVLAPGADGAVHDAVRGAMLVDASGRDLLGSSRTTYPEVAHWIGARFEAPAGQQATVRIMRDEVDSAPQTTTTLRAPDRTIVWAQVDEAAAQLGPDAARELVETRAREAGVTEPLTAGAKAMPVITQLWTSDEPARERVLKVGDSVRAPYFMTSTGAATALVHDAPRAVDAIMAVRDGAPAAQASGAYADSVRGASEALLAIVRARLQADVGATTSAR